MLARTALLLLALPHCEGVAVLSASRQLDQYFASEILPNQVPLEIFAEAMPKGGDLHNHLSGSVFPEDMLDMATEGDGVCIDTATYVTYSKPGCSPNLYQAISALRNDSQLRGRIIRSWSLYDSNGNAAPGWDVSDPSDAFFGTFGKTIGLVNAVKPLLLINELRVAAAQNVWHLETDVVFNNARLNSLAAALTPGQSWTQMEAQAYELGMKLVVEELVATEAAWIDTKNVILKCGTSSAEAACNVSVGFLSSVIRTIPNHNFAFAFCMAGFLVALRSPALYLGINIVGPEHNPVALAHYDLDMQMFAFFHHQFPDVKISLHAGELRPGLVTPLALRSGHIRKAVEVAGARRVGHGVAISHEPDVSSLIAYMVAHNVTVEICLTSNAMLLGVTGPQHPFNFYRSSGVGVNLNTDDQGILRNDLSREYARAAATYALSFSELKTLARNSIRFSFLPGQPMYEQGRDGLYVPQCSGSSACTELIGQSPLASAQQDLETAFARFEAPILDKLRRGLRYSDFG